MEQTQTPPDDRQRQAGAEDTKRPPAEAPLSEPKQPPKPGFAEFLGQWREAISSKNAAAKLRKLLKGGYTDEFRPDQAASLCDSLMEKPELAERVTVAIAAQARIGRLNSLSRSFVDEARQRFERSLDFYSDEFRGANAALAIENFVRKNAPQRRTPPKDPGTPTAGGPPPAPMLTADAWLRRFVVCICAFQESKVFLAGAIAAGKWWMSLNSGGQAPRSDEEPLVRSLAAALGGGAVSKPKLDLLLAGIRPLEQRFTSLLNRELELERRAQNAELEIERLERERRKLEDDLEAANRQAADAAGERVALQNQLAEAEAKYKLLDQHWEARSDQTLRKQSGSFREKVGHELQEALLSLERETPNVSMALLRLKRIQDILKSSNVKED